MRDSKFILGWGMALETFFSKTREVFHGTRLRVRTSRSLLSIADIVGARE